MTKSEVYNATLRKLGVLPAGETADTEDTTVAAEAFTQVCSELGISNVYVLDGTGLHLADMCASDLADDFQVVEPKLQRMLLKRERAKREILRLHADSYDTDTVTEAEFY